MTRKIASIGLILVAGTATTAFADGEAGDFALQNVGGILTPAIANDETGEIFDFGNRVLEAEFEELIPGTVAIDDPGFYFNEGDFAAGAVVTLNHIGPIRRWTGTDFNSLASDVNTDIGFTDGSDTEFAPASGTSASMFEYAYSGVGAFDEHPDYLLTGDQAAGIYVWEFELVVNNDSSLTNNVTPSLFVVFGFGVDDADLDIAVDYVADVLVPTPGAIGILGFGALAAARRRR